MKRIIVGNTEFSNDSPFVLVAGPCQLESLDHARLLAESIALACEPSGTRFVFKGSFDKANRSSGISARGVGLEKGLEVLGCIRDEFRCPVITDVHEPHQCEPVAKVVDILQIPAMLCRQTDLLIAAGKTGKAVNVKKGQFMAPWNMNQIVAKVESTGNQNILLCDRGTSFGYNMLVSDMRSLPIMAETGYPVIFDATHSVQIPAGNGETSGGQRQFVAPLARAAIAVGCAAIFLEVHQDPDNAPSDGPNMLNIADLPALLHEISQIDRIVKS